MVLEGNRDCRRIGRVTVVLVVIYKLVFTASPLRFRTLRFASMLLGGNCCSSTFARSSRGLGFRGFGQLSRALD